MFMQSLGAVTMIVSENTQGNRVVATGIIIIITRTVNLHKVKILKDFS